MKSKNILTLSASVAAGVSASGEVHQTILSEALTIAKDDSMSGINFHLSEGFAEHKNAGATEAGEFRLSFYGDSNDKPHIGSNNPNNTVLLEPGSSTFYAKRLNENDLIADSAGTFRYGGVTNRIYLSFQNSPNSTWKPGERGYVGLRFEEADTSYYGWAEIEHHSNRNISLHSFAYQDDGSPILAGTVIPEPKTNALLAALVAGSLVIYRRRRGAAEG